MNLKEFANVDSLYRDLDTRREISWHEYMGRVIYKLGIENIKPYIPFHPEYLVVALAEDIHLNNTDMRKWNEAAGYYVSRNGANVVYVGGGISSLFLHNGITCFSLSDGVCVLKEAARMLCSA